MCSILLTYYVMVTFSYSYLHNMTNSIIVIFKVGVQVPEWQITLQFASFYDRQEIFMWSNCLLDLGTDFLVGNMVFI